MVNACYRCKQRISSEQSFCSACRERHGANLQFLDHVRESRLWMVTVIAPIVAIVAMQLPSLAGALGVDLTGMLVSSVLTTSIAFLAGAAYAAALYQDCLHVRRHDVEWQPSKVGYAILAFLALLTMGLLAVVVTPYHLYRRKKAIGLPT